MVFYEAKNVRIKRKHTDKYPAININPAAILKNKVVLKLGSCEKCRMLRNEFVNFLKELEYDEEIGKYPKSYHSKNKDIISVIKIGNKNFVKLTNIGKRRYNYLINKQENE